MNPPRDQQPSSRDEKGSLGTNGGFAGISGSDWTLLGAIAAVAFAIGIVNALSASQDAARRGLPYEPGRLLFWELSSIIVILLATPLLVIGVRRLRQASGVTPRAATAVITIVAFSATHIAGMIWFRKLILYAIGSGYDFGVSFTTLLYEFRKDVVTAVLIGSMVWLADDRRATMRGRDPSPPAVLPEQHGAIWLRDGPSRIRVDPRQVLWVASAGNYIEYRLGDGTEHLIRGTLAAAETELAPFDLVRVHRTRLANIARVTGVAFKPSGDFELTFDNGQTLQGSRRYRAAIGAISAPGAST